MRNTEKSLVALAISLDGNGIKFGLGDNGDLSVEVDAKIKLSVGDFELVIFKLVTWQLGSWSSTRGRKNVVTLKRRIEPSEHSGACSHSRKYEKLSLGHFELDLETISLLALKYEPTLVFRKHFSVAKIYPAMPMAY